MHASAVGAFPTPEDAEQNAALFAIVHAEGGFSDTSSAFCAVSQVQLQPGAQHCPAGWRYERGQPNVVGQTAVVYIHRLLLLHVRKVMGPGLRRVLLSKGVRPVGVSPPAPARAFIYIHAWQ